MLVFRTVEWCVLTNVVWFSECYYSGGTVGNSLRCLYLEWLRVVCQPVLCGPVNVVIVEVQLVIVYGAYI